MSLKDINIKPAYESSTDDIINDFYGPVLSNSVFYDRIAGFFTSSSLAIAARGISTFISNRGKMRLITSPILDRNDIAIIKKFNTNPGSLNSIECGLSLKNIEDTFINNHVKALGWMLREGILEIKFAIVYDEKSILTKEEIESRGLFHQKVGILKDDDNNMISFSGSINETAAAWVNNDEEFKVFQSWNSTSDYFYKDLEKFDEIWNGKRQNIKVFNIPNAIKHDIISYSKDFNIESIALKRYKEEKEKKLLKDGSLIPLFPYQSDALIKWRENNFNLLFEMATGTGKTRTAIGGLAYLLNSQPVLLCIISCPQNTLLRQWKNEVEHLKIQTDCSVIIDGTNHNWRNDLYQIILKQKIGLINHGIIYTTHNTASSDDFISIINQCVTNEILFIGDEAHWLGAKSFRKALLDNYKYRIGLSATPSRWYDDAGTKIIKDYFGNNNFEFTIKDALSNINPITQKYFLVNYYYHISKVSLTEDESEEYQNLTHKISSIYGKIETDTDAEAIYERLIEKRANLVKNAHNKFDELKCILDSLIEQNELNNLIIFVSPQQIDRVKQILFDKGIIFHQLTQNEGTTPKPEFGGLTERQYIINNFINHDYNVLIAIKCLDEGIDIPSASRGILLSSSTNPREYIQRIGRIIRQAPGKSFAHLYDICVSSIDNVDETDIKIENQIKAKEIIRLKEIAENAINCIEALTLIQDL